MVPLLFYDISSFNGGEKKKKTSRSKICKRSSCDPHRYINVFSLSVTNLKTHREVKIPILFLNSKVENLQLDKDQKLRIFNSTKLVSVYS